MPYFFNASNVYCEHVGEYLQDEGNNGDIKNWYTLINRINGTAKSFKIASKYFFIVNSINNCYSQNKYYQFFNHKNELITN
jgi:hypothetical protein